MSQHKNVTLALEWSIPKGLFAIALPVVLGNLLQSSYQFVDAYWIGRISEEAVSAVAVSGPIAFLIISLGMGFSMAGTILVAQYVGAKNKKMVDFVSAQTIFAVSVFSIFLSILGIFASESILSIMSVEQKVMELAVPYLQTTFAGLLFVFVFSMFQSLMRGVGEANLPTKIIAGTAITNLIIDPLFIMGWGPIPAFGPMGAALATLITQGIAACIGIYILLKWSRGIKIHFRDFKPDFAFIKKAFWLGFPSSLEMSARSLSFVFIMTLIAGFGTAATAAFGAGGNIFQLVMIPAIGFSVATSTMVGQNIGAKNLPRAEQIVKIASSISFLLLAFLGIFVYIFAENLALLFLHEGADAVVHATKFIEITAFCMAFIGVQFTITGVFRASGNMMLTLVLAILSGFVIQFPLAFILSHPMQMGIDGIWWSFLISTIIMVIIEILIYLKGDWKKCKITQEEFLEEKIIKEWEKNNIKV